jgi:hypothetical protein
VVRSNFQNDAVIACGGCASSFRADISSICKDDCNDGANIELSGADDSTTATGFKGGSSRWKSLPHRQHTFTLLLGSD